MAFKKETTRQQFSEAIAAELQPGERVLAGGFTVSGPSPMLAAAVGAAGMLLLGMRSYYMAVTDRRVVMMRASGMSGRPRGLAFADPRAGVSITKVRSAAVWSHLKYRRPDGKQMRLNFHRKWRDDMEAIVQSMSDVSAAQPAYR
jgi:hypothetical protein